MALFASHFIYRYGSIDTNFGEKYTSGCKFSILFFIPIITGIWWSTVVRVWFWPNTQMDDYTRFETRSCSQKTFSRNLIMETVGVGIENISYIGAKFYNQEKGNLTSHFNTPAWIGVAQMWFMVVGQVQKYKTCLFNLRYLQWDVFLDLGPSVIFVLQNNYRLHQMQQIIFKFSYSMHWSCKQQFLYFLCTCQLQFTFSVQCLIWILILLVHS
ncbi:hypothetical protein B9Z55_011954 [Caenorhabditis nigoni]|uniref:Uncharacterized protein n=1 Tax=Caenorhabditis nigoni TaxID=1611254 RepID=A0A2G5TV57_9PELO|nr:hypothetical protein B9Z55_011954 [Caenorhabditis nigoni]